MSIRSEEAGAGPSAEALEFERRTRQLLLDSVESLPAATRSRLTRARHAALSSQPSWSNQLSRHWMPAGAGVLAAVAVAIVMALPHGEGPTANPLVGASAEDMDMLADSDAVQLGREGDVDYDFYEWAVGEATGAGAPSVGT
jgi:hypothetical protein